MRIELVCIGEEILQGTLNTHAAYLGAKLADLGWKVSKLATLLKFSEDIEEYLQTSLSRADLIIMTGGLSARGCVRPILAKLFHPEPSLFTFLKKNEEAFPPVGQPGVLLGSKEGTLGFLLEKEGKVLIALPGCSFEMRLLFEEQGIPFLQKRFKEWLLPVEKLSFLGLSAKAFAPIRKQIEAHYPKMETIFYQKENLLHLVLRTASLQTLREAKKMVQEAFPQNFFPSLQGEVRRAIHTWMIHHHKTLALAESCTGGKIAAELTALPGASDYVLGSFVTYSNSLKKSLLGVSPQTLHQYGAVSEETTREMLQGLFDQTEADYGLAITGLAGPKKGEEKFPVGTLFIAVGARGKPFRLQQQCFPGKREDIQCIATHYALGLLHEVIHESDN